MIKERNSYSKYIDIDIDNYEYVKKIPEGWNIIPNIAIFEERISRGHINEELISVTISRGIIKKSEIENKKDTSNEDKSNYKLVKQRDIAYNKMRMWQGAVGFSKYRGIVSPAYVVLKPKMEINSEYYHYLFRTNYYRNYCKRFSYGLCDDQLNLRYCDFKRMYSIVPPIEVQNKIVTFLNKKVYQANIFIENQKKLVESLIEKKKVIINEAVTKGVNLGIEMKDSDLEWLNKIPVHWESIKIKYLLCMNEYGLSVSGENEGVYKYLTMGNIQEGKIKYEGCSYLNNVNENYLLMKDDILFNRTNSLELVGKTGIFKGDMEEKVTFASYLVRFRCKGNVLPDYLNYYLNADAFISYARSQALLSLNQANLNPNRYTNIKIAIPNFEEQQQILKYIELKVSKIDRLIEQAEKEVQLTNDYLESLIFNTVTGQIKVE